MSTDQPTPTATDPAAEPDAPDISRRRTLIAVGGALLLLAVLLGLAGAFAVADRGDWRTGGYGLIALVGFGALAYDAFRPAPAQARRAR